MYETISFISFIDVHSNVTELTQVENVVCSVRLIVKFTALSTFVCFLIRINENEKLN